MPRSPRPQIPDGVYHVMARGVRRSPIYGDDADRKEWISTLADVVATHEWSCHAYCLMTNHFHLLVRTPLANISPGMHRLNALHAQWFNWRYGYSGHVFERRFHSVVVDSDPHLLELTRYIVLNPERAGLCRRAEDWRWSSLRAMLGLDEPPPFLTTDWTLGWFHRHPTQARSLYRRFVDAGRNRT